jgi:hypothetical protein
LTDLIANSFGSGAIKSLVVGANGALVPSACALFPGLRYGKCIHYVEVGAAVRYQTFGAPARSNRVSLSILVATGVGAMTALVTPDFSAVALTCLRWMDRLEDEVWDVVPMCTGSHVPKDTRLAA